jgi:mannosidase alpha-like ER degradation enhancer 1
MGDYALTLVDSLDSFAVMGDRAGFEIGVRETIQHVQFDLDSRIQVFEVVIRMLGGLLSAHQLAIDPHFGFALSWYKDELLMLARDLGRRLLPSFNTPTGIPYPRIHLQRGVRNSETLETCTAGAGSLLLEMGTLSRLTGDPSFEVAARKVNVVHNTTDRKS